MGNSRYYIDVAENGLKNNLRYNEYILDSLPYKYQQEFKQLLSKMRKFDKGLLEIGDSVVEDLVIMLPAIYEPTKSMYFSRNPGRWIILTVGGADTTGPDTLLTYNRITEKMIVQDDEEDILSSCDSILSALIRIVELRYLDLKFHRDFGGNELERGWELFNKIFR